MKLLHILYSAPASFIALFLLSKLMGNREMSQLSMFDYIIGISIGSIAAEMATAPEYILEPLVAMTVYAVLAVLITVITSKSIKVRRALSGETLVLMNDGKLYEKNFKKAKMDLNEFMSQCRTAGYFNIADIQTAILEQSGKLSFLPLSNRRPATPDDLNLSVLQEKPVVNVVIDGRVLTDNLKFTGNDKRWLMNQINEQGISKVEDVFLATCDNKNNLSVYVKNKKNVSRDMFE